MFPTAFSAPQVLARLNVAAVGLALSAATAAIFGLLGSGFPGVVTGPPTLLVGTLWAFALRRRGTIGNSGFRWTWLWSLFFAPLNAGLACGLAMAFESHGDAAASFVFGLIAGATFGVVMWFPALILTLLAFGVPIAWAQHLARKGLAGEERGEIVIGVVCTLIALGALALSMHQVPPRVGFVEAEPPPTAGAAFVYGVRFMRAAGMLGALVGAIATALAARREAQRRRFVEKVAAGDVAGFRIEETPEGKALVRVDSIGHVYRVSDFARELYLLDREGRAVRALDA